MVLLWTPLLLLIPLGPGFGARGCFRSLGGSPYETDPWFGNQYDGRFTGMICLAVQRFRWALKLMKVNYENWRLEIDYAKCITKNLPLNVLFQQRSVDRRTRSPKPVHPPSMRSGVPPRRILKKIDPLSQRGNETLDRRIPNSESTGLTSTGAAISSRQDELSLLQELYTTLSTLWKELSSVGSHMWNWGIAVCTRAYMKHAFWRWVDKAPF